MSQILSLLCFLTLVVSAGAPSARAEGVAQRQVEPPRPGPKQGQRKFLGFRLSQVDPGSVYEKAGLKVGDLVKSLNDKPIVEPDDLKELPVILERDKVVVVKIERAGKRMTLRYRRIRKASSSQP